MSLQAQNIPRLLLLLLGGALYNSPAYLLVQAITPCHPAWEYSCSGEAYFCHSASETDDIGCFCSTPFAKCDDNERPVFYFDPTISSCPSDQDPALRAGCAKPSSAERGEDALLCPAFYLGQNGVSYTCEWEGDGWGIDGSTECSSDCKCRRINTGDSSCQLIEGLDEEGRFCYQSNTLLDPSDQDPGCYYPSNNDKSDSESYMMHRGWYSLGVWFIFFIVVLVIIWQGALGCIVYQLSKDKQKDPLMAFLLCCGCGFFPALVYLFISDPHHDQKLKRAARRETNPVHLPTPSAPQAFKPINAWQNTNDGNLHKQDFARQNVEVV